MTTWKAQMRFACLLTCLSLFASGVWSQTLSRPPARIEGGGPIDVEAVTGAAGVIVRGIVLNSRTRWVDRVIYTEYTLSVQETLKGRARNRVTVAVPGGAMGNVELVIPGAPSLSDGEELVFFGQSFQGQSSFKPVGVFDGIVPVRQGAGVGATVAPRGRPEDLSAFLDEVRGLGRNR